MSYVYQSADNSPCHCVFTARNKPNVWMLRIGRKINNSSTYPGNYIKPTTHRQCNRVNVIKYRRGRNIVTTNIQGNIPVFSEIRHIQEIGNKLISLTTEPPTHHIGDLIKIPI